MYCYHNHFYNVHSFSFIIIIIFKFYDHWLCRHVFPAQTTEFADMFPACCEDKFVGCKFLLYVQTTDFAHMCFLHKLINLLTCDSCTNHWLCRYVFPAGCEDTSEGWEDRSWGDHWTLLWPWAPNKWRVNRSRLQQKTSDWFCQPQACYLRYQYKTVVSGFLNFLRL